MPLAHPSDSGDARWVRDFLENRSEDAFRRLYRGHSPYLFALALRLTGGQLDLAGARREEAEDVHQEAWLRAARRLESFQGTSSLRTWLGGILINCWRERRRRARPVGERMSINDLEVVGDDPLSATVAAVDLERALAGLSDELRAVVVLFELHGYTHEEIGRALEIPTGTSKSRLFLARRALARALGVVSTQETER